MNSPTEPNKPPVQPAPEPPARLRALYLPAFVAVAALLFAACGSESGVSVETGQVVIGDSGVPTLGEDEEINPAADDSDSMVDDASADADGEIFEPDPSQAEAIADYEACLADEGVDIGSLEDIGPDDDVLLQDPEFIAADQLCQPILEDAFGSIELDPAMEVVLAERSAEMAACGREVLGVEIPDDVLLLDDDDPRLLELEAIETTPEEEAALDACAEEILGDLVDDDGGLVMPEEEE